MAPRHRLSNQIAAHSPGTAADTGASKKNHACAPSPERDRDGEFGASAGVPECGDIVLPFRLVEVRRKEPARLIGKQGIDAGNMASPEVVQYHAVAHRHERLVRTFPATHPRLLAHAARPFIAACAGIAGASGLAARPQHREDIVPVSKQRAEQGHLFGSGQQDSIPDARCLPGQFVLWAVERIELRREVIERTFRNIPPSLELPQLVLLASNRVEQRPSSLVRGGRRHRVSSGIQRVGETLRHIGC